MARLLRENLGPDNAVAMPLLDANFTQPPFFLEMNYGGPNLRQWAEENNRLADLPTPQRLALFLQIAKAVAAAHRVGVMHKDLKPSNVLVGANPNLPQALLTDFGSGRALDLERLKRLHLTDMSLVSEDGAPHGESSGQTKQTPGTTAMYLAPELQAGQTATLQCDVYALGIMLYQLMVGNLRRPLSTGWHREINDALLVDDITAATEGEPLRRLSSAQDLVQRLEALQGRRLEQVLTLA